MGPWAGAVQELWHLPRWDPTQGSRIRELQGDLIGQDALPTDWRVARDCGEVLFQTC